MICSRQNKKESSGDNYVICKRSSQVLHKRKENLSGAKRNQFFCRKRRVRRCHGPSGSGKSTLLNCISCYIPFEQGTITLGGTELRGLDENELAKIRNEKLGFVFQDFMLLDGLTVRENILVPRIIQGNIDTKAALLADQLTVLFGIDHIQNKYPADISGGERQRAAVARSLVNNPLLILADEPLAI